MDGVIIALAAMIFFYAVLFLSFAVHKRMSTDTTIRFVLVILISVEACNAAVCPLSYYLQQPGHPLYREDINGRVKYSILTIYATQLFRLVFTLPWFFLKDKELINEVVFLPLCISSLITNVPFVGFLGRSVTLFIPIGLLTLLIYTALSIVVFVKDTLEDAQYPKLIIPVVVGLFIMSAAWAFTVNTLSVLNNFIRTQENSSPNVYISSFLIVLVLTIPAVATLMRKIASVRRKI